MATGSFTLADILGDIGAIIAQDTTQPTGTDLTVQVNLINQAVREWASHYQWRELRIVQYAPSIALSMTSMALPDNFKKLMSRPFRMDISTNNDFEEVRFEDFYPKISQDVNQRFCAVGGNPATGKFLVINPALPSGASLLFDYQMYPSSLTTLTDVSVCPHRGFIMKRVLSKIYESRADPRFQTFQAQADTSLQGAMEEEAALSGAFSNRTKDAYAYSNFRPGVDG